jgi:hypothetical protein
MSKLFVTALVLMVFTSCGKGVENGGTAANSTTGAPPSTTTAPPGVGGTITPTGCPAEQLAFFNFAQTNPPEETIDLNISGSTGIISVMVNGQDVSYQFDANAGAITLADGGQPGQQIQIEVCLPSPTGKPTGKPTEKPEPGPSKTAN